MDDLLRLDAEETRRAAAMIGVFLDDAASKKRVLFDAEFVLQKVLDTVNQLRGARLVSEGYSGDST